MKGKERKRKRKKKTNIFEHYIWLKWYYWAEKNLKVNLPEEIKIREKIINI